MEKKIGEIFEYNGEWYQCVIGTTCHECDFSSNNISCDVYGELLCTCNRRSDETSVVFKKLEKVGEPYIIGNKLIQRYKMYPTTYHININGWYYHNLDVKSWTIDIEIKQTKEDIEKNLKPFNLDAAKQGKPVCTRDGCKARIICFDRKDNTPIVALIERVDDIEILQCYHNDGKCFHYETSNNDLMMFPEKKEGWILLRKDGYTFVNEEAAKKNCTDEQFVAKVEWEE